MAIFNFTYNCNHFGKIEIFPEEYEERLNILDEISNNDCPECKNKILKKEKIEKCNISHFYLTVKTKKHNITLQNLVSIKYDLNSENLFTVAKNTFIDICSMDNLNQSILFYEIFTKNENDQFIWLFTDYNNN